MQDKRSAAASENSITFTDPVQTETTVFAVCLALFLTRFVASLLSHSSAVRCDSYPPLAYAIASAFRVSYLRDPRIREEAGKRRLRYILAAVAAFLLFEAGFTFFARGLSLPLIPEELTRQFPISFLLLCGIALRAYLGIYATRAGHAQLSRPLRALSAGLIRECILSSLPILVLLIDRVFGRNFDNIAVIPLSLYVIWCAVVFFLDVIRPAVQEDPDPALLTEILGDVTQSDGILGVASARGQFFGPGRRLVSMRVRVPADGNAAETRRNLREIETVLGEKYGVTLVLHAEAEKNVDRESLLAQEQLTRELIALDPRVGFNHFHMIRGADVTNLIFDLYVPEDYPPARQQAISDHIRQKMTAFDPKYSCIISLISSK